MGEGSATWLTVLERRRVHLANGRSAERCLRLKPKEEVVERSAQLGLDEGDHICPPHVAISRAKST